MNHFFKLKVLFSLSLLFFLSFSSHAEEANSSDIKSALKEAGVSALPEFLDAATNKITITMPKFMGGKKLTFGGTIDAEALAEKKFVFSTSDDHQLKWKKAFGMSFLDLDGVALNLAISSGSFELSLDASLGGAFKHKGKDREVVINFAIENDKITDFTLSLPDTKLSLKHIKELNKIPGVKKFAIEDPTISLNAIGGKIDFIKDNVNAVVFYDSKHKGWHVGFQFEDAITLAELTGHKKSFLKDIALPAMTFVASSKKIDTAYDELPLAVQNFYTNDDSLPDGNLELSDGVTISATFDPSTTSSDVQKALSTLGLGKTSLEIDGAIENMFEGSPSVELTVDIDTPGNHGFKVLNIKDTKVEFFMSLSKEEAGLGFRTAVLMSQGKGKSDLEFDVDFGLKESETNIEVQVAGAMKGDWKNAAHIKGFTLENPYMSVGITETGSFDMLIDGTVIIGSERVRAAADMVLSPEALGLPTAFAVAGEINKLDFNDLVTLSKKHAKQKGGGFKHMNAELKDVAFAFMTPGAHLPADLEDELSIEGSGMALKATLLINNHEIATANGYASTEGMSINGKIDPFKLGPLQLKEATLDIAAGPSVEPKFEMSGDIVLFKGFEEKYLIDIEPSKFELESDTKFGGLFDAKIHIKSDGLNFKSSKDVSFDAELATNYSQIFHQLVEGAIKGMKKANKDITKAENSVKSKRNHLTKLKSNLAKAKKDAKRSYDHAVKKINDAENKVNKLKKTIAYNNKKAHDYHNKAKSDAKHLKLAKAGKDKVKEAELKTAVVAEEAALKTAKWALEKAKKADKVITVDAAPKVIAIQAEIKTAQAALDVAVAFMDAAKAVNSGVADSLKAINKASTLKINKLGVSGSVEGIVSGGKKGDQPVLTVDVTIHGHHHVYHITITSYKTEFKKLVGTIAKDIAKEIVNVFKK